MEKESTLTKLLSDPLSKEFSKALIKAEELHSLYIGKVSDPEFLRHKGFDSIDELKKFIGTYYDNPEYVFNSLYELATLGQEIRNKYPSVSKFTSKEIEILVLEVIESREKSNYYNSSENLRIQGQCEDELDSSLQTCQDAALVGVAGCGLLTPTLLGALGCGAVVYLGELVCIDDANRSYDICKNYEN
ncbi:hypothetical protein [Algoriphagus hitonicola]|uniref:Uncharacterized protein n=1 Tax=Algoriphagus hitonicola TaxID=435880 RepID=A0A1I2UQR8_9BACT|nr:hypothetical protein [Algoriphagus hitonicola]SFG78047.1 hypothetical protein SAMN04487988_10818 [Algoriphagus hitonicola]